EPFVRPGVMNDLTRVKLGVSADPVTTNNWLNLNGSNVWVNLNDTGVDASHPDLTNRMFYLNGPGLGFLTNDFDGHGTHVAGIIAGSGLESTLTNYVASGSVSNANFRGKAPLANLFIQPIDLILGADLSDKFLQENAALTNIFETGSTTNTLISNNSWGYVGLQGYTMHDASFDAAVRDALPKVVGRQPIAYVFAAGNSGEGTPDGLNAIPDTISSPAAGKNVIT